jgi:hypothetical protein
MKDILGVLKHLGYRELRPETAAPGAEQSAGEWRPLSEVNGRFDTTDETHILTRKRKATCRLVDAAALFVATVAQSASVNLLVRRRALRQSHEPKIPE